MASSVDLFRKLCWGKMNYTPTRAQNRMHKSDARLKAIFGGVRAGKSLSTAMEVAKWGVKDNGLGWLIGPSYELARPEFDYLLEVYTRLGVLNPALTSRPSRGPCKLVLDNGFTWQTKSADDLPALAGYAPDVIGVVEAAQCPEEVKDKAIERATEKDAPVIFSGTFEKSQLWYIELYDRWSASNPEGGAGFSIPTWSNLKTFPGGRRDGKIASAERSMSPELFNERYGGIPSKPSGLVFKRFERARHCRPLEDLWIKEAPIEVWVDPATRVYSVLFVQRIKENFHVLDELYCRDELGQDVVPKAVASPWWPKVVGGIIDIAGSYRQGANKSQIEVWQEETKRLKTHGVNFAFRYAYEQEWREAIQLHLYNPATGNPMLFFADHLDSRVNADGTTNGILGEFMSYKWREVKMGKAESRRPIKQNEDALSALGYGIFYHKGPVVERRNQRATIVRGYF